MAGGTVEGRRVWRSSSRLSVVLLVLWATTNLTRLVGVCWCVWTNGDVGQIYLMRLWSLYSFYKMFDTSNTIVRFTHRTSDAEMKSVLHLSIKMAE